MSNTLLHAAYHISRTPLTIQASCRSAAPQSSRTTSYAGHWSILSFPSLNLQSMSTLPPHFNQDLGPANSYLWPSLPACSHQVLSVSALSICQTHMRNTKSLTMTTPPSKGPAGPARTTSETMPSSVSSQEGDNGSREAPFQRDRYLFRLPWTASSKGSVQTSSKPYIDRSRSVWPSASHHNQDLVPKALEKPIKDICLPRTNTPLLGAKLKRGPPKQKKKWDHSYMRSFCGELEAEACWND
jgi:hypothetical protein